MAGNQQGRRWSGNNRRNEEAERRAIAVVKPRLDMPVQAKELGYQVGQWKTFVEAIWPSAKTVDGVMMALNYCKARNLDPFKRPVHVVPMWNSKLRCEVETVWPGIGELRTTASRTSKWAGNDECLFGRVLKKSFREVKKGENNDGPWEKVYECPELIFPEWAQVTVYKMVEGQRVGFVGPKVYFLETFSGEGGVRVPNTRWRQAPRQMLEKCAEAAALRRAFPEELAGEYTAEEMEGKVTDAQIVEGQYDVVDDSESAEEEQSAGDQSEESIAEADDDGNWDPLALEKFMSYMRDGLARVPDVTTLDAAIAKNRLWIDKLPEAERKEIDEIEARTRARLDKPAQDAGDRQEPQDAEYTEAADEEPVEHEQREEPPYLVNFRTRLASVEFLTDLQKLETVEKRVIENQPAWVAAICDQLIEAKRTALTTART